MCELLGMSANVPTDICFSFSGLVQRGGGTGLHKDGWGITFYEGLGCRTFKDPLPSIDSPIALLVQDYPIKSCAVVSHIRQANRGRVALENTHPFTRELWGRHWTFVHNGQLRGYRTLQTGNFRPVGQTDSEQAFCWLLARLAERYPHTPRHWPSVFRYIAELAGIPCDKKAYSICCYPMAARLWAIVQATCLGLPGARPLAKPRCSIRMWKSIFKSRPHPMTWSR